MIHHNFKINDKVTLTTGGASMLIKEIQDDTITCFWITENGTHYNEKFASQTLKHHSPAKRMALKHKDNPEIQKMFEELDQE